QMPMFIKGGTILPEYPVMQYVGEKKIEALKLNVYYSEGEHHSYGYTDHGDTFAFEQNVYLEKHFIFTAEANSAKILQQRDGLFTERYDDYHIYLIGFPFEVKQVTADGIVLPVLSKQDGEKYVVVDNDFKKITIE